MDSRLYNKARGTVGCRGDGNGVGQGVESIQRGPAAGEEATEGQPLLLRQVREGGIRQLQGRRRPCRP